MATVFVQHCRIVNADGPSAEACGEVILESVHDLQTTSTVTKRLKKSGHGNGDAVGLQVVL